MIGRIKWARLKKICPLRARGTQSTMIIPKTNIQEKIGNRRQQKQIIVA